MSRDELAAVKDLHGARRRSEVDLLADEAMWNGKEEGPVFDVIVGRDTDQSPFRKHVIVAGKACECGTLDILEQLPSSDTKATHDMIVDAV